MAWNAPRAFAALRADDCPLDDKERSAAHATLSKKRARNYWQFLGSKGGVQLASRYRKRASLPAAAIADYISLLQREADGDDTT